MKKVYISGPITGHDGYMRRFGAATDLLREQGCIVYNPAAVNSMMSEEATYEEYMAIAMTMLSFCDTVYMLRGWRESTGASTDIAICSRISYTPMPEGYLTRESLVGTGLSLWRSALSVE